MWPSLASPPTVPVKADKPVIREGEQNAIWNNPEALALLIDYNDVQQDQADSMGAECVGNQKRSETLTARAVEIITADPDIWSDDVRARFGFAVPQEAQGSEPKCKDHPDAPHGFNRDASHNAGRYVCDCEGWEPVASREADAVQGEPGGIDPELGDTDRALAVNLARNTLDYKIFDGVTPNGVKRLCLGVMEMDAALAFPSSVMVDVEASGWHLVPLKPTKAMLEEIRVSQNYNSDPAVLYAGLLAAAPSLTGGEHNGK